MVYTVSNEWHSLKNAPETFQRDIDIILSKVRWQFALVYLDDVIIFSKTFDQTWTT